MRSSDFIREQQNEGGKCFLKYWEINPFMERRCRVGSKRRPDTGRRSSSGCAIILCKKLDSVQQFKDGAESTKTISFLQSHKMPPKNML